MFDSIIGKVRELLSKKKGKAVGNSYLLGSMYPITFIINKIPENEKPRIIQLLYNLITHRDYSIRAQIYIIDGKSLVTLKNKC
jgi:hypothetical protein